MLWNSSQKQKSILNQNWSLQMRNAKRILVAMIALDAVIGIGLVIGISKANADEPTATFQPYDRESYTATFKARSVTLEIVQEDGIKSTCSMESNLGNGSADLSCETVIDGRTYTSESTYKRVQK
jgi:hypothetical protein